MHRRTGDAVRRGAAPNPVCGDERPVMSDEKTTENSLKLTALRFDLSLRLALSTFSTSLKDHEREALAKFANGAVSSEACSEIFSRSGRNLIDADFPSLFRLAAAALGRPKKNGGES